MRVELLDATLFVRKTISVFAASFVLLPLLEFRSTVPAMGYAIGLVVLHIFVLAIYLYRVQIRRLAGSWRGLGARLLALLVVLYLLLVFSKFEDDASRLTLALQLLAVAVLHAVVLLLLSARLVRDRASEAASMSEAGARERR